MGMNWAILQEDKLNYSSQNDRKFSEKKKVRHVGKPRMKTKYRKKTKHASVKVWSRTRKCA